MSDKSFLRLIIIGSFVGALFSCQKTSVETISFLAPNATGGNYAVIALDKLKNGSELLKLTDSLICAEKPVIWSFKQPSYHYNLQVLSFCSKQSDFRWCPSHANFIELRPNHFVKNEIVYPYDSLKSLMLRDHLNFGQDVEYANSPEKAFLMFAIRPNDDMATIKKILGQVALSNRAIPGKKYLFLHIGEAFNRALIPPPPPQ